MRNWNQNAITERKAKFICGETESSAKMGEKKQNMFHWKEDCQPDSMTESDGSADQVSSHALGKWSC